MKRIAYSFVAVVVFVTILAFKFAPREPENIRITVTSEKPTKFDMFQNTSDPNSLKTIKGLETPYEFTVSGETAHFIFKSQKANKEIEVNVVDKLHGGKVMGKWPVVVIVSDRFGLRTFGID